MTTNNKTHLNSPWFTAFILAIALAIICYCSQLISPYPDRVSEVGLYTTISYHLWQSHQWLLLHTDRGLYLNKPPMQFWLTNLLWRAFGLKSVILRLLPAFAAFASLTTLMAIFKQLFPEYKKYATLAPLSLFSILYFTQYTTIYNQDMLLTLAIAISIYGLLIARKHPTGWIIFLFGLTFGTLIKGPVIFIFILPATLLAPRYLSLKTTPTLWRTISLIICIASMIPVLLWLYFVYQATNPHQFFSSLSTSIISNSAMIKTRHSYFRLIHVYFLYPLFLIPLTIWPYMLSSLKELYTHRPLDSRVRWLISSTFCIWIIFVLLPHRYAHYLLPLNLLIVLITSYSMIAKSERHPATITNNKPFAWLCCFIFLGVLTTSPWLNQWIEQAHGTRIDLHYSILFAAIGLPASLWHAFKKTTQLVTSLLSQVLLAVLVMLLFISVFENYYQDNLKEFYQCLATQTPHNEIGYLKNYNAYTVNFKNTYSVAPEVTLPGVVLNTKQAASKWLSAKPNRILIYETHPSETAVPQQALCHARTKRKLLVASKHL